jgi:hypothetical protein
MKKVYIVLDGGNVWACFSVKARAQKEMKGYVNYWTREGSGLSDEERIRFGNDVSLQEHSVIRDKNDSNSLYNIYIVLRGNEILGCYSNKVSAQQAIDQLGTHILDDVKLVEVEMNPHIEPT